MTTDDPIIDIGDDPILRVLRASAPTDDTVNDARTALLLVELARAVPAWEVTRVAPPRRRSRLRYAIAAAAMLSVLVLSAFAFETLTARTGWFGDPASTETDGSEFLLTSAPDFGEVLTSLVPDLPLPEGATWQAEVDRLVEQGREEPALRQEAGARAGFVFYAHCAWVSAWVNANERGDASMMAAAAQVLEAIPERPEMAAIDGGGVRNSQRAVAGAARDGDVEAVRAHLAQCGGFPIGGVQ